MKKEQIKNICSLIGCSGVDKNCPGNSECKIIRKILRKMK